MKLSGWTRLWIVASVIWGGAGAWLISRPDPARLEMPPIHFTESEYCLPSGCTPCKPEGNETGPWCRYQSDTAASYKFGWELHWSAWIKSRTDSFELPAWSLGPFAIGLLMVGVGWVRKGFQPVPEKKSSVSNPPDSA